MKTLKLFIVVLLLSAMQLFAIDAFPGTALEFDGVNDYITGTGIDTTMTAVTIEAWVKHSSLPAGEIQRYVTIGSECAVIRHDGQQGAGQLHFYIKQSSGSLYHLRVDNILTTNEWIHVAGTYDGVIMNLYLNGELIKTATPNGGLYQPNGDFEISRSSESLNGKLDEIRLWNSVRTEQEIRENMYLSLDGTEIGLLSNWQFNNGSGTTLTDVSGTSDGTLINMEEADWVDSSIPFGGGAVNTQIVSTTGVVEFTDTDISMDITEKTGTDTLVVSKIELAPNIDPLGVETAFNSQYWVVGNYGGGTFATDISLIIAEDLTSQDETSPSFVTLYSRSNNSDTDWTFMKSASSVEAISNKVIFEGVTDFGQFIICKESQSNILVSSDSLDFGTLMVGDSLSLNLNISNTGIDTLFVSNISTDHVYFSTDTENCVIPPSGNLDIVVTFMPNTQIELDRSLTIISNDFGEPELEVILTGKAINYPEIVLLSNPISFTPITDFFNGIDVGDFFSIPTFTDLDSDGLLDMLIGEYDGNINHYEQDAENSTLFTLVTTYFNGIDVGIYSAPAFTDLDGDGLLDMLIGEGDGNINHYEQDSENPTSFTLATASFNGIDVGSLSAPSFTDLDSDGLLDMLVGEFAGNINHYEQDAENSTSFSLVTTYFNGINVGDSSKPTFTDLDGDGSLDMLVGESTGNINHYEQDAENSTLFTLVTTYFNGIDVGGRSGPTFTDLDGDGLLDMLVGKGDGNINHYEQDSVSEIDFGGVLLGNYPTRNYIINARSLVGDLSINCTGEDYSISLSEDTGYTQSFSITPIDGVVSDTIYVRFEPTMEQEYTGNISHTSQDAGTKNISLLGYGAVLDSIPGTTLDFDGIDAFVNVGDDTSLDLDNTLTIEAWVKPDILTSRHAVFSTRRSDDGGSFQLEIGIGSGGTGRVGVTGLGTWVAQTGDSVISTGEWTHIAYTRTGTGSGTHTIYINGEVQSLISDSPYTFTSNTSDKTIGAGRSNGDKFDGRIDEVRVWNVARTEQEIRESINLSLEGNETGLVSYWQFNDGSSTVLSDAVGVNSGTLTNMDTLNCWVNSTIPFGGGYSDTQIVSTVGVVDFIDTNLSMDVTAKTGVDTLVVSKIELAPNILPEGVDHVFDSQYWVMNSYGSGITTADISFAVSEDIGNKYEGSPGFFKLYGRTANSDSSWTYISDGISIDTLNDIVTFSDVSVFQQYIVSMNNKIVIDSFSGTALEFDGVNDYIDGSGISTTISQITVEAWIKHNELTPGTIQRYVTVNPEVAVIRYDNIIGVYNTLHFYLKDGSGALNSIMCDSVLTTGDWMHIVGTYDGSNMKLYLNGALLKQLSVSNGLYAPDGNFSVSKSNEAFNGCLDEVRIWDTARTDQEIRESMYSPLDSTDVNLISYWQFNEGTGTSLFDGVGNTKGTLINMDDADWVNSTIPFGPGPAETQIVSTTGVVWWDYANFYMNLTEKIGTDTIVVKEMQNAIGQPNITPEYEYEALSQTYWIVNKYGNGTFSGTFYGILRDDIVPDDESHPEKIGLFRRPAGSDGEWSFVTNAYDADEVKNRVYFNEISEFGQLLPARKLPDVPANLVTNISGSDLILSWDPVTGATSYKVYSSDDPYGTFGEDFGGTLVGEIWTIAYTDSKKFYYVVAVEGGKVPEVKKDVETPIHRVSE